MNKTFKQYYKESYQCAKQALKGIGKLKYYVYLLMRLLAIVFPFALPVVSLMGVRIMENINKNKKIDFSESLKASDQPISYWNHFLVTAIQYLIAFAIIIVIALITYALYLFGLMLCYAIRLNAVLIPILFAAPGAIALLAFIIAIPYIVIPVAYVINENPKLSCSKVFYNSIVGLRIYGKKIVFLNYLMPILHLLLLALLCCSGSIVLSFVNHYYSILLLIIGIVLFLIFSPRTIVTAMCVKQNLFKDLLQDTYTTNKALSGVITKNVNKTSAINNGLSGLFVTKEEVKDLEHFDVVDVKEYENESNKKQKKQKIKKTKKEKVNKDFQSTDFQSTENLVNEEISNEQIEKNNDVDSTFANIINDENNLDLSLNNEDVKTETLEEVSDNIINDEHIEINEVKELQEDVVDNTINDESKEISEVKELELSEEVVENIINDEPNEINEVKELELSEEVVENTLVNEQKESVETQQLDPVQEEVETQDNFIDNVIDNENVKKEDLNIEKDSTNFDLPELDAKPVKKERKGRKKAKNEDLKEE